MVENFVDIPDDFCCPITGDLMEDPVVAADGHSYERESITAWFQRKKTSPLTGLALKSTVLLDNHSLKAIINKFKENIPKIQLENQIKIDLLEAINMREAFLEDHLKKEKEQLGNLANLYGEEKEKNLSLERKLATYLKQIKNQSDIIDTLNKDAEDLVRKRWRNKVTLWRVGEVSWP
ncbi:unnamed protein product [Blepharisma stoltei]|uniref:U-box domain-containing protein n=1 Tax=Blepharisma stoltei TaxID=1481888 RepID=A0AAU9J4N3_9CILI|nr:unnamed protein product [Blepharisma stoltei]